MDHFAAERTHRWFRCGHLPGGFASLLAVVTAWESRVLGRSVHVDFRSVCYGSDRGGHRDRIYVFRSSSHSPLDTDWRYRNNVLCGTGFSVAGKAHVAPIPSGASGHFLSAQCSRRVPSVVQGHTDADLCHRGYWRFVDLGIPATQDGNRSGLVLGRISFGLGFLQRGLFDPSRPYFIRSRLSATRAFRSIRTIS